MPIVHKGCGGKLEIDKDYHPHTLAHYVEGDDKAKEDIVYGVKCSKCGARVGTIAEVEDAPSHRVN